MWHIINTPYAETAQNATAERFFEEEKKILLQLLFGVCFIAPCPPGEGAATKKAFCVTL